MRCIILALILVLLIAGCAKVEVPITEPTTTSPTTEPAATQTQTTTQTQTKQMSQQLKDLIVKTDKVKSMAYFYDDGVNAFQAYVKDNFMKIEFTDKKPVKDASGKTLYDTAYIDLNKRTAVVYCERYWSCRDIVPDDDTPVEGAASFGDFITQTPIDLIKSVQYAEINPTGGQMLDNGKNAVEIDYTNSAGNSVKIWIWDFRGIPLIYQELKQVGDQTQQVKKIEYHEVSIDTILIKDVTKQT